MNRHSRKARVLLPLVSILFLVLYCEKKHGAGKPLEDFSQYSAPVAPEWARKGVIYEIYVRAFSPEGNFVGVEKRLPYLKELGVDILWLMPIYPIGEKGRKGSMGSPYSVKDFRAVNPEFGSANEFKHLVQEIHRAGMKVIIDLVPNHASNDNNLMQEHPDWFMRDRQGNFTREVADWSDVTDFNYDNPEMRKYMQETMLYWIREFDIDGYRCDVAGMVPKSFWEETIPLLRDQKPDLYLLAEWEDPELLIAGFNSDYDWTLYHVLRDVRSGKKRTAEAVTLIHEKDSRYPQNSLPLRFLENHDEPRSLKVFGATGIEAYASFIFAAPGIPLLYAGQEIGETVRPTLFEKTELDWANVDRALLDMYHSLIRLRKDYSCFTEGSYVPLPVTMFAGLAGAYLREDDRTAAIVITNLREKSVENLFVSVPQTVKERLKDVPFVNVKNPADTLRIDSLRWPTLLPYSTQIFVGEKQRKSN